MDQNCSPTSAQEILLSDSEHDDAESQHSDDSHYYDSEVQESAASDSDIEMISCKAAPCTLISRSQPSTFREPPDRSEAEHPEHAATPQRVDKKYMDWAMGVYVRLHESGAVSPAEKFVNGPNGFKMAVWSDGDMVESEISNIDAPELPIDIQKPAKSQAGMKTTAT